MFQLAEVRRDPASRRRFLSRMTAAGLGAAAAALFAAPDPARAKSGKTLAGRKPRATPAAASAQVTAAFPGIPGGTDDEVVLNFALTLERLEADLYRQALNRATGMSLRAPLNPNSKVYSLAAASGLNCEAETDAGFAYLKQFAYVEAAHRDFLIAVIQSIGGTPVGPNPNGYQFPGGLPGTLKGILQSILPLEETGVRAYLGAAGYLTTLANVQTAATIYSTEARHSAAINLVLELPTGPTTMAGDLEVVPNPPSAQTFEKFITPATAIQRASTYFA